MRESASDPLSHSQSASVRVRVVLLWWSHSLRQSPSGASQSFVSRDYGSTHSERGRVSRCNLLGAVSPPASVVQPSRASSHLQLLSLSLFLCNAIRSRGCVTRKDKEVEKSNHTSSNASSCTLSAAAAATQETGSRGDKGDAGHQDSDHQSSCEWQQEGRSRSSLLPRISCGRGCCRGCCR